MCTICIDLVTAICKILLIDHVNVRQPVSEPIRAGYLQRIQGVVSLPLYTLLPYNAYAP
jgi:hypothetical protein